MARFHSMSQIEELRHNQEMHDFFKNPAPKFRREIKCFHENESIFDCELVAFGQSRFTISDALPNKIWDKVRSAIDRAGSRLPYQCELYPSHQTQIGFKDGDTRSLDNIDPPKRFENWFLRWLDGRILVPDTCIIQDHYLSKVLLPRLTKTISIKIPRFVILELEIMGNKKEKYMKRIAFSAFNEIRNLRLKHNASIFPNQIKSDILANFAGITSSNRADSFIRSKIGEQMRTTGAQDTRNRQMVMITRDMIMACTASAENIDTFYLSPRNPANREYATFHINDIMTELAVSLDKIRIEGYVADYSILLEGMWPGKTITEWENHILKWELVEH